MKSKMLIDNNAVDFILENEKIFLNAAKKYNFYVCTTVVEELAKIPDNKQNKRIALFITFSKIGATFIPDSCAIFGHSRYGGCKFGKGTVYHKILNDSKNNIKDAIIADTAVSNDCILLTNDSKFYNKMKSLNYNVMNFAEFKEENENNG